MLTDVHTHTSFSPDGTDDIFTMLSAAKEAKVKYYGVAEHFDFGLGFLTPAEDYFPSARALKKSEKDIRLIVGAEFGFEDNAASANYYNGIIEKYSPDFIVNSVHSNGVNDYYYLTPFEGRNKKDVYREYFSLVLKSLSAPYRYDIVGHIGYCSRYAPYADKKIIYSDFSYEIDKILEKIIEKDKILEINSSAAGSGGDFLPDGDVLERYYNLGGRNISFASDAHSREKICFKRGEAVKLLKDIGFTHITVPVSPEKRVKEELE